MRARTSETSLDPRGITPVSEWVDEHGGWSYTTVVARTTTRAPVQPINAESSALRWCLVEDVAGLPLHHGFAAAWPHLRALIERIDNG